jgi:uncharacterized protein (DUF427 family)
MNQAVKSVNGTSKVSIENPLIRWEPSQRWVRVELNGQFVADSKRAILAWPQGHMITYYFPIEDVNMNWLEPARFGSDGKQYYDLRVGDRLVEAAAWTYPDPSPELEPLRGFVTFKWSKMDHWYEEEEEIFVHPRDPHHRVDTVPSSRHVQVVLDGVTIADSHRPYLLFETGLPVRYYIPQEDVRMEFLEPSRASTVCPYKGAASYWSIKIGDELYRNYVWGYMDPVPEIPKAKGLLSFFNEKLDIYIDGELEQRPQTLWSK